MIRLRKAFDISLLLSVALICYEYFWHSGLRGNQVVKENIIKPKDSDLDFKNNLRSSNINLSVQGYYERRKQWATSNLGSILFKNNIHDYFTSRNKTFVILLWRYWGWLKKRHLSSHVGDDPFDTCSVNNCVLTSDDKYMSRADAVVIHVQHGILPSAHGRRPSQRWVFLSDESAVNAFSMASRRPNLAKWANIFNWSMTYRSDADVPVPYGRTIPLPISLTSDEMSESITNKIPFWNLKKRNVLMAALISHCRVTERTNYIKELQKYLPVDVYGKCSEKNLSCPGHIRQDCPVINKYVFYLAFENTKCRQYLTEKIFHNAYAKGAIPIILGAPREDCDNLLPPYSFLHVDNYPNPEALAEDIKRIVRNEETLLMYHYWRRHYEVVNEHGFFKTKSYHICRLCEALNYNDEAPKVYGEDELKLFFDPAVTCSLPDKYHS